MNRSGYLSQEIYGVKRETAGLDSRLENRSSAALYAAHIAESITDSQGLLIVDEVATDDLNRPRNIMDRGVGVS